MKLYLVALTPGKKKGTTIPIHLAEFVIGRDPDCHLRPKSPIISQRHCAILVRDGRVFVKDFGSANGTFINNKPVQGEAELRHDDRLRIGFLSFGVRIESDAAVADAPS